VWLGNAFTQLRSRFVIRLGTRYYWLAAPWLKVIFADQNAASSNLVI
jgi:hypothetical protein